ncbi:MAG: glycosyltransferase family 2 protein [Candidatus Marinimicrobia bacterium]|nr:glycosyltransferase family 2 protein [Candidatus Neomarinimicrobiota bacterium]
MRLTVVIPIYNESATCQTLIERVKTNPIPRQIIVIDDGSTDGSTQILRNIKEIDLIKHDINQGKGAAVQTAIPHIRGDYVILQDGDLEYNPSDYKKLLQPLEDGTADAVYGSRWLGKNPRWTFHYIGNRLITFLSNLLNGANITDMASCYKAMPSDILRSLDIRSTGFGLEAEITAKLFKRDATVVEVPIDYKRRTKQAGKKLRIKDGVIAAWSCLKYKLWG